MDEDEEVNGHRRDDLIARLDPVEVPVRRVAADQLSFDIDEVSSGVIGIRTDVPSDAYTAPYLGTERAGNGLVISDDGLVLTIGYLILECRAVEVVGEDGVPVPADLVGYDFETGFGLVRATRPLGIPPLELGRSDDLDEADPIVVAARGGRNQAMIGVVISRREFAGYWEYLLDNAIFTAPAHPNWSGAALLDTDGKLCGVGSLIVEQAIANQQSIHCNMFVPIDELPPILDELVREGRVSRAPRPWLGMFTSDAQGDLVVVNVTPGGPADRAGVKAGDIVVRVAGVPISGLSHMYHTMWELGPAGVTIPITVIRETAGVELNVKSGDRYDYFQTPRD